MIPMGLHQESSLQIPRSTTRPPSSEKAMDDIAQSAQPRDLYISPLCDFTKTPHESPFVL